MDINLSNSKVLTVDNFVLIVADIIMIKSSIERRPGYIMWHYLVLILLVTKISSGLAYKFSHESCIHLEGFHSVEDLSNSQNWWVQPIVLKNQIALNILNECWIRHTLAVLVPLNFDSCRYYRIASFDIQSWIVHPQNCNELHWVPTNTRALFHPHPGRCRILYAYHRHPL